MVQIQTHLKELYPGIDVKYIVADFSESYRPGFFDDFVNEVTVQ